MMSYRYSRFVLPALVGLLFAACDRVEQPSDGVDQPLVFAVSETIPDLQQTKSASSAEASLPLGVGELRLVVDEDWLPVRAGATRAATLYGSADTTPLGGADITVWSYKMASSTSALADWTVDVGPVKGVYNSTKKYWEPATSVSHNTTGHTRWFAVAPEGAATVTTPAAATAPTVSFTVNAAAASQVDLMYGTAELNATITSTHSVDLAFEHALAGVRLRADKSVTVTAATLSGVYNSGTFNLLDGTWSDLSGHATSSFALNLSSDQMWDKTQTGNYDYVKDAGVLLMIPQRLPQGAKLTVTVDGESVEADLSGHELVRGKIVNFRVAGAPRDYHIEVDLTREASSAGTSTEVAMVRSYSTRKGDPAGMKPAPWKIAGVYASASDAQAGGSSSLAGWNVSASSTDGYSNATPEKILAAYTSSTGTSGTVDELLAAAPEWGSSDAPWNLSNRDNGGDYIVESANTYIINAPGWYRLPLVAGNGVKNGQPNTSAYPSNFVDYKGISIATTDSPYLHDMGTPSSADIVWTETTGMVENLSVAEDASGVWWLKFNISSTNIKQGCTVVSVKDGSDAVMWSWLLWVTDYEPGAGDVAAANATFMPRNLGWVVDGTVSYAAGAAPGVAFVRVESVDDSSVYAVVRIRRAAGAPSSLPRAGHGPFFQWGRKDAFPPSGTTPVYDDNAGKTPADLIKNPFTHFSENGFPFRLEGYRDVNWWSATASGTGVDCPTVKTVYDPCPAGYTVPRLNAFDGYASATWVSGAGYDFTFGGGTLFLPLTGRRKPNNNADYADAANGNYWVAVPQGNGTSRRLLFGDGSIVLPSDGANASSYHSKAAELAIRPAVE